ncbi:hypothetical protein ACJX0J_022558, partial [Zea mays]
MFPLTKLFVGHQINMFVGFLAFDSLGKTCIAIIFVTYNGLKNIYNSNMGLLFKIFMYILTSYFSDTRGIYIYKNLFLLESNFHVYTYELFSDTSVCLNIYNSSMGLLFNIMNQIRYLKFLSLIKSMFQEKLLHAVITTSCTYKSFCFYQPDLSGTSPLPPQAACGYYNRLYLQIVLFLSANEGIYIYKNLFLLESTRKKKIFSNNFHVYTYELFSDTSVCL